MTKHKDQYHWLQPQDIETLTEYHSTATQMVPLLFAIEGEKYPVIGWYVAGLQKWRNDGPPSGWVPPIAWLPMPIYKHRTTTSIADDGGEASTEIIYAVIIDKDNNPLLDKNKAKEFGAVDLDEYDDDSGCYHIKVPNKWWRKLERVGYLEEWLDDTWKLEAEMP